MSEVDWSNDAFKNKGLVSATLGPSADFGLHFVSRRRASHPVKRSNPQPEAENGQRSRLRHILNDGATPGDAPAEWDSLNVSSDDDFSVLTVY